MKNKLFSLIFILGLGTAKAADVSIQPVISTSTISKVVELEITFAPPPTAEVKKQRKTFAMRAGKALCSGAFVSPFGHILTAKHCVAATTEIMVITSDKQVYEATIREVSKTQDLAIIQIGRFNIPFFKLAPSLAQGETVQILGSPLGLTDTITSGIVAKLRGDTVILDCTALPGNSGGPVLNAKGELAGIVSAIIVVILGPSHLSVAQSVDSIRFFFYEATGGR